MQVREWRCFRGPNPWSPHPVWEVQLEIEDPSLWSTEVALRSFEFLAKEMQESSWADRVADAASLARRFATTVVKLQALAGTPVSYLEVLPLGVPGRFRVAVEIVHPDMGEAACRGAVRLLRQASNGEQPQLVEVLAELRALEYGHRLNASVAVVAGAARARGIPVALLSPEYGRLLRLGQGAKQRRILASEPDSISAVARVTSTDKHLAKHLLHAAGVPVPVGRLATTADEAWTAVMELGLPVAVKPLDSDLATGVSLDVRTRDQVEAAFHLAQEHSTNVLIERFAPGIEHRVLVVADKIVAVTRIDPPHVVGDGQRTVAELVARINQNPRRGDDASGAPLSLLKLDDVARKVLETQGHSFASILKFGERVLLRRNPPYFKNGGTLVDCTESIHPSIAAHAIAAAQAVQLQVAGLDVVAVDITRPLEEQQGVVVEINAGPGLWLHLAPWADTPRPVGEAIVASLFSEGEDGRIPVVAVVGDANGAVVRMLAESLTRAGRRVGISTPEEMIVAGRRWPPADPSPHGRIAQLMQLTAIDVALVTTTARELESQGFGNDRCDVAMVLDSTPGEWMRVLKHALGSSGTMICGATDPSELSGGMGPSEMVELAKQALNVHP